MAKHNMFIYAIDPIDFWAGWLTEKEYTDRLPEKFAYTGDAEQMLEGFKGFRDAAFGFAKLFFGWDGDIREGPFVIGVPNDKCEVIVAWKQDNNGTTFIASPHRLPWLKLKAGEMPRFTAKPQSKPGEHASA